MRMVIIRELKIGVITYKIIFYYLIDIVPYLWYNVINNGRFAGQKLGARR